MRAVQRYCIATQVGPRRWFVKTGAYRQPQEGEWFLSGAIPEVYQASDTLEGSYHIMREVSLVPCPHCGGGGKIIQEEEGKAT